MNFIVDAQLPRRLARALCTFGHDAVHTLELRDGNHTTDAAIIELAVRESRIVVTKDNDFVTTFLLGRKPPKLLLVSTGNISNAELLDLFAENLQALEKALLAFDFVELSPTSITVHA